MSMLKRLLPAALAALLGLGHSGTAAAGGLTYSNQFAARYNPLGLQDEFMIGWREKLGKAPADDILFGKSHIWMGGILKASPQFVEPGLFIKALPIAVLEVQAFAVRVVGISDLQSTQDSSLFTQATKDMATGAGGIINNGWMSNYSARLQYKGGPVAIRNTAAFTWFYLEDTPSGRFYDQTLDVVTDNQSWVLQNDADVLYADDDKRWVLGGRYTFVRPFSDPSFDIQRVGPLFAYKFKEKNEGGGFANPALIAISQWHVEHAERTGQSTSQAIPYFALVFSFNGQITD
jgi:hypothetical protein